MATERILSIGGCWIQPRIKAMSHNQRMIRRTLLFIAIASLMLIGCGDAEKEIYSKNPPNPKKVIAGISLSPGTTEIWCALSPAAGLRGRTSSCDFPESVVTKVPVVADVKPNYEMIQGIRPDLIVYDADLYSDADVAKLKETKADLLALKADTIKDLEAFYYDLGRLLGCETNASSKVDKIEDEINIVRSNKPKAGLKVAAIAGDPSTGYLVAGTKSFLADVIRTVGGEPVGADSRIWTQANLEALIAMNPDVIFVAADKSGNAADKVLGDARLSSINAIKKKQVFGVNSSVLMRKGSRVPEMLKAFCVTLLKAS